MTQDNESAFGRGFRNGYGESDSHQTVDLFGGSQRPLNPPPVDYTMPILVGCLTALLIALVLAMAWRRKT